MLQVVFCVFCVFTSGSVLHTINRNCIAYSTECSVLRTVLQLQRLLQALPHPAASRTAAAAAAAAAEINVRCLGDPAP